MALSFRKVLAFLNPSPEVGGLQISESALRYIELKDGTVNAAALRLPPGILENGRVKSAPNFIAALKSLRVQIPVSPKKPVHAIISLPSAPVFAQAFSVPFVAEANLEEAARLNLQMISPMDPKEAYSDWQRIGEAEEGTSFDLLGALIERKVADAYAAALKEAGFAPVAAEFSALSLTRLVAGAAAGFDSRAPHIIINVSSDGIDYAIVRNGNLYFDYFVPWRSISGAERQISADVFKNSVVRNLQQVINFHAGKWGGPVKNFLLVAQGLQADIKEVVLGNFPDAAISELALAKYARIPPVYFTALGAALRGRIPRGEDTIISLLAVGTEDEYRQSQLRLFISFWRNALAASLGFLAALFLIAELFLARTGRNVLAQLREGGAEQEVAEVAALEEEAKAFNRAVNLIGAAKEQEISWSPLLQNIHSLASRGQVSLSRVSAAASRDTVLVSGLARSEETAIAFRRILEEDPQIEKAELPLSLIVRDEKGFTFSITLTLKR